MARSPYASPYVRLVANVCKHEGCWLGTDTACRFGYQRPGFYVPGLRKRVKLSAHIATWVIQQAANDGVDIASANDLYLAYKEFRSSGMELDHTCVQPACRRPEHLEPVTHSENIQRIHDRKRASQAAANDDGYAIEHDPEEVEF